MNQSLINVDTLSKLLPEGILKRIEFDDRTVFAYNSYLYDAFQIQIWVNESEGILEFISENTCMHKAYFNSPDLIEEIKAILRLM